MNLPIVNSEQEQPQDRQQELEDRDLYLFSEELKSLPFLRKDSEDALSEKIGELNHP